MEKFKIAWQDVKLDITGIWQDSECVFFLKRNFPRIALVCVGIVALGALFGLIVS